MEKSISIHTLATGYFTSPHVSIYIIFPSERIFSRLPLKSSKFPETHFIIFPKMAFFLLYPSYRRRNHLLVILISLVVDDVEELELVNTAGGGDDTEPVTKLLLLEELLGPVFYKALVTCHLAMSLV